MRVDLRTRPAPCCTSVLAAEFQPAETTLGVRVSTGCWTSIELRSRTGQRLQFELDNGALDREAVQAASHSELTEMAIAACMAAMARKPLEPREVLGALQRAYSDGRLAGRNGLRRELSDLLRSE